MIGFDLFNDRSSYFNSCVRVFPSLILGGYKKERKIQKRKITKNHLSLPLSRKADETIE
jgi:hypothetical protein